jgi:ATP-dependent Clp protease ATP-binding subunit ClpA
MYDRYTEKARRAIFFAHYEASQFGSTTIETEHLLLGLLREAHTAIKRFLGAEVSQESIREQIAAHTLIPQKASASFDLPLTNESKRVLAYAAEEAQRLGVRLIGTEHLLLGLLREEDGFAAQMLQERGVTLEGARREILASYSQLRAERGDILTSGVAGRLMDETAATPSADRRQQPRKSFAQYNERARRALFFARLEASQFGASSIETEHLLLGLLREGKALLGLFAEPVKVLQSIRTQIEQHTPRGNASPMGIDLPLTEECRQALYHGAEEAQKLNRDLIGPEHLLMGVLREEQSFAAQVLRERGVNLDEITRKLAEQSPSPLPQPNRDALPNPDPELQGSFRAGAPRFH